MGSLGRKMARAARNRKPVRSIPATAALKDITDYGIFCDCHGTLYGHNFEKDELLVSYLNAKYLAGESVTLVSTDPHGVRDKIRDIGLNKNILMSLTDKRVYMDGRAMEFLIDDDPVNRAGSTRHPRNEDFRAVMRAFLETKPPARAPHI